MSSRLEYPRRGAGAAFALALAVSPSLAAWGYDLVSVTPWINVTIPSVTSQTQLAHRLQSQGYSDVKLSSLTPNPAQPKPELYTGRDDPETTPVHEGWNGTAVKDGRTFDVRVSYGTSPSVAQLPQ